MGRVPRTPGPKNSLINTELRKEVRVKQENILSMGRYHSNFTLRQKDTICRRVRDQRFTDHSEVCKLRRRQGGLSSRQYALGFQQGPFIFNFIPNSVAHEQSK